VSDIRVGDSIRLVTYEGQDGSGADSQTIYKTEHEGTVRGTRDSQRFGQSVRLDCSIKHEDDKADDILYLDDYEIRRVGVQTCPTCAGRGHISVTSVTEEAGYAAVVAELFAALEGTGISFQYGEFTSGKPATIGGIQSFTADWEPWDSLTSEQKFQSSKFSAQHALVKKLAEIKGHNDPAAVLAARDAATKAEALAEAADAIQALHPGETKASVTFLRERALVVREPGRPTGR
jgi:hypothetical protein